MQDPIIKKKTEMMKSIMMNPKLSKTFREAMSAPIGSTKREQVKSILSIMKKVGGLKNDGMGGPNLMGVPQTQTSIPETPNYSNMVIFPAAPKLKIKQQVQRPKQITSQNSFDGTGGPLSGLTINPFASTTSNVGSSLKLPSFSSNKNSGLTGNINNGPSSSYSGIINTIQPSENKYNLSLPPSFETTKSGLTKSGTEVLVKKPTTIPSYSNTISSDVSETALTPGQFGNTAPIETESGTQASAVSEALKKSPVTAETNIGGYDTTTGKPKTGTSSGSNIKSAAQSAVNEGTGPGLFAMGVANEKFGGSLDKYIADLDAKLKVDFNLEPLEKQLSDLKAAKSNLVPTLTQYIQGKDQYLKFIDKMIDKSEDDLLDVDMSDPASADRYNNYMNYLYTLKGRQTQRYGNFLNSAISDYNAELEATQSNYDTVYQHYSDAITRQGTIAQNEYNTLYTAMSDLYTNLENAPIKRANLEALQLQNEANRLTILKNSIGNGQTINPDYWKDVQTYTDMITSKEDGKKGTLDLTTLTDQGLAGYYNQNLLQGGDEAAMTEAIRRALSKTLETSSDPATISKVKSLIVDLSNNPDPAGAIFASSINNSIAPTTSKLLSSYILGNLDSVKSATKNLVKGSSGFLWTGLGADKPGIEDKETWIENNSSLDKDFLESLYNAINVNVGKGTAYEQNPSEIIDRIFSGTNEQISDNLANIIAVSS